ncbi:Spindle and kinetochore-associated protein 1 [Galdieria sulphuraria]|nr:Spindle and kinetochore-associated protein 1 [Galdieria sulphuraria]
MRAFTEYLNYLQERINELKSLFFFRIDETDGSTLERITNCLRESSETLNKAEKLLQNLKIYVQSEQEAHSDARVLKDLIESFERKVKGVLKQLPEGEQSYVGNYFKDTTYSYGNGTRVTESSPQNHRQHASEKRRTSTSNSVTTNISAITVGKVSPDELSQVPQYLKGRLTTEKVNQITEKLDSLFREKYTLLSKPLRTLSSAEIDKVTEYRNQEVEQVVNSYFLSDHDLKNCSCLKFDTTTKNTLHVLRHLGRLKEVQSKDRRLYMIVC